MRGKDAIRPLSPGMGAPSGRRAKKVTNPPDVAYNKGDPKTNRKVSNVRNYSIHHVPGQHLSFKERKVIERVWNANCLLKHPKSVDAIAKQLGLSTSTLRRELFRGGGLYHCTIGTKKKLMYTTYSAQLAEDQYRLNLAQKGPRQKMTNKIEEELKKEMDPKGTVSPETALHNLHLRGIETPSLRTIYNHIHSGALGIDATWLPYNKHRRRMQRREKRVGVYSREGCLIDDVPTNQLSREEFGTWEMDTVVSKQGCKGGVLVLIERMTRYYIVCKLRSITQSEVHRQLRRLMRHGSLKTVKAVITDNGCEFLDHDKLKRLFSANVYYTHVYSSWEKGSVENANAILRRFFPKGTDFTQVPPRDIAFAQTQINNIYRRVSLKGQTAHEAFSVAA